MKKYRHYVLIAILAIVFLSYGCIATQPKPSVTHSPAQDSYWYDRHIDRFRICPEGMFDEENRGKIWWTKEELDEILESLEEARKKQGT